MSVKISKAFDFDAAHHLPHVPDGHKCKRIHGHTYRVEVVCEGEIDARGMVVDYAEIAEAWAPLDRLLDHRYLNTIPGLENPTTEVLAPFILRVLSAHPVVSPVLAAVRVYESSTTYCEVTMAAAATGVLCAVEFAAAQSIRAHKVGVAELTHGGGAILLPARPEVAARESHEHRRPARVRTFTMKRVEDLLDRVAHGRASATGQAALGSSRPRDLNASNRSAHESQRPQGAPPAVGS